MTNEEKLSFCCTKMTANSLCLGDPFLEIVRKSDAASQIFDLHYNKKYFSIGGITDYMETALDDLGEMNGNHVKLAAKHMADWLLRFNPNLDCFSFTTDLVEDLNFVEIGNRQKNSPIFSPNKLFSNYKTDDVEFGIFPSLFVLAHYPEQRKWGMDNWNYDKACDFMEGIHRSSEAESNSIKRMLKNTF